MDLTKFADMILIADSGSSKTDWAFVSKDTSIQVRTGGINPVVMGEDAIQTMIREELLMHLPAGVTDVWFYGAGCLPGAPSEKVEAVLSGIFEEARISVKSDLVGAAKSVLGDHDGIVAILGTGSNSGLCINDEIIQNIPPLGYILGDEGSGTWFGKRLMADYLRGIMPETLRNKFGRMYNYLLKAWVPKIYGQHRPNRTLASLAPFLKDNKSDPYCMDLIMEGLHTFFKRNIVLYPDYKSYEIAFAGSLASVFEDELKLVLEAYGMTLYGVEKEPMLGLIKYHLNKIDGN